METKIRATRSFWHVTINGKTVEIARWNGGHKAVSQIEALNKAQAILVARRAA